MGNTRSERKCSVSGCSEKHHAKGYCKRHYDSSRDRKAEHTRYSYGKRGRKRVEKPKVEKPKVQKLKVEKLKVEKPKVEKPPRKPRLAEKRYAENKELKAARNLAYRARRYGAKSDKIKREDVFEACKWICQICGKSVDKEIKYPNPLSASIDHIVPLSKGGTHTKDNVQLAHFLCNSRKGARVS